MPQNTLAARAKRTVRSAARPTATPRVWARSELAAIVVPRVGAVADAEGRVRTEDGDRCEEGDHALELRTSVPRTLALISSTKPRLCLDLAAAPVLPRSFRPRLVQRRRGRAAHGAAVAVRAGPPARGRARRAALPARRS